MALQITLQSGPNRIRENSGYSIVFPSGHIGFPYSALDLGYLCLRNVARIFYFCLKGTNPVPLCLRQQKAWARRFHPSSLETGHLRAPSDLRVPGLFCRTVPDAGRICPPHACLMSCHFRLPALILWCEFPRTFLPLVRRPEKPLSRTLRGQSSRQRQGQSRPAASDCAAFCSPSLATLQPF